MNYFKKNVFFLFIMVLPLLTSCTPEKLNFNDLNSYLQDESNGVKQAKVVDRFNFSITYKPNDLLIWQEVNNKKGVRDTLIAELKKKYNDYDYYTLSIDTESKDILNGASSDFQNYSQNLQTLAFRMNEYVYAITESKDTIALADFYFPRLYGIGERTQVMLAFNKLGSDNKYMDIFIEDIGLGVGTQVFRFNYKDIKKIPSLEFKI